MYQNGFVFYSSLILQFRRYKTKINNRMLILLLDGYLSNRLKLNEKVELDYIMVKYKRWEKALKQSVYKEEFF